MADLAVLPSEVDPEVLAIVERVRSGDVTFAAVAREKGWHRFKLYRFMLSELGDKYHELVTDLLTVRISEADEGLENAEGKDEVAKRKAIANFARMDLERRRPALYGPKQEVKHSGQISRVFRVEVVSEAEAGVVVDGTPVPSALPAPAE
jgi:hypothetical protein